MTYLNYEEYKELSADAVSGEEFRRLNRQASNIFDVATQRYYQGKDFDTDYEWRQEAVKLAITYQIDFFNETGTTSFEGLNSKPQAVSLGRTRISKSSGTQVKADEKKSLLSVEAQSMLIGTGLLYRGVRRG